MVVKNGSYLEFDISLDRSNPNYSHRRGGISIMISGLITLMVAIVRGLVDITVAIIRMVASIFRGGR